MYWIIGICLFVGVIWLQFNICKKGRKRAGIILPVLMLILTAAVALILSTSEVAVSVGSNQDSNGNMVTAASSSKILSNRDEVLKVIVIGGICTITFGGIYVVFNKKKSSAARELKKMSVQDL